MALLSLPARIASAGPSTGRDAAPTAVIPPGQEELIAAMLGRGAALPEGCAFASGQIEQTLARGTYRCPGGDVVVELRHPEGSWLGAAPTEKIAIVPVQGTPPAALLTALRERVHEREGAFEWRPPAAGGPGDHVAPRGCWAAPPLENALGPYVPGCYPRSVAVFAGFAQTLVVLLGLGYGLFRLFRLRRVSEPAAFPR